MAGQGTAGAGLTAGRSSGGGAGRNAGGAGSPSGGASTQGGRSGAAAGDGGVDAGASAGASAGSAGEAGDADCGTIETFEDGKRPSIEIHVATTGSDASGDGSLEKPFASIERAARDADPGTAVRIHAGTYEGGSYLDALAGTESDPIWLGGTPGEARPVIEGGSEGLHLSRARWVIVHDLELREQTANGINADDAGDYADAEASHSLVFRNLFIHDVGQGGNQDCLKLSGIRRHFVLDSEFARCGGGSSGSGVDHVGCHDGLIARNVFSELSGNAVQCKGGSSNLEVRWNRIINGGQRAVNMGGSTGFEFFRPPLASSADNAEARNIRVIANVIEGGIAALGFVGCVECLAANNTIVDPENWILRILQETTTMDGFSFLPAQNGRFVNNLIYFARGELSTTINVGANTDAASFTFQNNLWYAHDDATASKPTDLPALENDGIYGEDPKLAEPAQGNYALGASSPAAHAGTAVPELIGDIEGGCFADPPSIGAFEAR